MAALHSTQVPSLGLGLAVTLGRIAVGLHELRLLEVAVDYGHGVKFQPVLKDGGVHAPEVLVRYKVALLKRLWTESRDTRRAFRR